MRCDEVVDPAVVFLRFPLPLRSLTQASKNTSKFYTVRVRPGRALFDAGPLAPHEYTLKQPKPDDGAPLPKKYFAASTLRELVLEYVPHEKTKANVGVRQPPAVLGPEETEERECFLSFVTGLLAVRLSFCVVCLCAAARTLCSLRASVCVSVRVCPPARQCIFPSVFVCGLVL